MGPYLIYLLALQLFYATTLSKVLTAPRYAANSIAEKLNDYSILLPPELTANDDDFFEDDENDDEITTVTPGSTDNVPFVKTTDDKTEVKFHQPIEAVNIDYTRNTIVLKFHKNNPKMLITLDPSEKVKQKSLQDNFIRFGKRAYEQFPSVNSLDDGFFDKNPARQERSHQSSRDARGDNFMRFGRSINNKNDFMRFGRAAAPGQDFMRFGRAAAPGQDFMRFGRAAAPGQDFMRFGRAAAPGQDFMRFGRAAAPGQDFMRFGRTPSQDFMRFGRTPGQDFMRFGRAGHDNFMRFGRASNQDFMRFGRNSPKIPNFMRYSRPDNFMRFGRTPPRPTDNFIRFGKSLEKSDDKNSSKPLMGKNELKEAVKLIHEADKNADNENPVDKAIKVLFDKHQQEDQMDKTHNDEPLQDDQTSEMMQHNDNDLDSDLDYFLKMSK